MEEERERERRRAAGAEEGGGSWEAGKRAAQCGRVRRSAHLDQAGHELERGRHGEVEAEGVEHALLHREDLLAGVRLVADVYEVAHLRGVCVAFAFAFALRCDLRSAICDLRTKKASHGPLATRLCVARSVAAGMARGEGENRSRMIMPGRAARLRGPDLLVLARDEHGGDADELEVLAGHRGLHLRAGLGEWGE